MRSTMTRLTTIVTLLLFTAPLPVVAQQQGAVRRLGVLMYQSRSAEFAPLFAAFHQGLSEAGYVEGQNLAVEWRDAQGDYARLPAFAAELVRLQVEAIFAVGPQALKEAKSATGTLPIVAIDLESDPVEAGYVVNLARPGGNVTGVFLDLPELMGKWLELMSEIMPIARVGALWDPTTAMPQVQAIEQAVRAMRLQIEVFQIRQPQDVDHAFAAAKSARLDALVIISSPLMLVSSRQMADLARTTRLPALSMFRAFPLAGGLMSYGPAFPEAWKRVGIQVSKILGGMKAAELAVERPSRFELVINLKTAKELGLPIPPTLLFQADEVLR
jgi:putative ABC transport system substrate-binding protein